MRKFNFICLFILAVSLLAGLAGAATFQLTGGQSITGTPVSPDAKGVIIKLEDGSTSDRVAWEKFSQDDLKKMAAASPKIAAIVDQYIEPTEEEKKSAEKAAIVIKTDYDKLELPAAQPLFKALCSSGIGRLALFLIYLGNIYAAYEISIFRARQPGLVCGIAAVAPVLGPIIFLCLPTQVEDKSEIHQEPAREKDSYQVEGVLPEAEAAVVAAAEAEAQANALPATQVYRRGQFTFNRRFFESKFPGFLARTKTGADADMMLIFQSGQGEFITEHIVSVGADQINIQTPNGEVLLSFLDIQEVVLKHRHA